MRVSEGSFRNWGMRVTVPGIGLDWRSDQGFRARHLNGWFLVVLLSPQLLIPVDMGAFEEGKGGSEWAKQQGSARGPHRGLS